MAGTSGRRIHGSNKLFVYTVNHAATRHDRPRSAHQQTLSLSLGVCVCVCVCVMLFNDDELR